MRISCDRSTNFKCYTTVSGVAGDGQGVLSSPDLDGRSPGGQGVLSSPDLDGRSLSGQGMLSSPDLDGRSPGGQGMLSSPDLDGRCPAGGRGLLSARGLTSCRWVGGTQPLFCRWERSNYLCLL